MPFQHVQKKHFLICKIPILLGAEQIDTSQKVTFVNYGDNSGIVHARVNEHGFVIRCINPNLFLEEIRFPVGLGGRRGKGPAGVIQILISF